jgi:hypothetical protein
VYVGFFVLDADACGSAFLCYCGESSASGSEKGQFECRRWLGHLWFFAQKKSECTVTNAFLFVACEMQVLFCECVLVLLARLGLNEVGCACWRLSCGFAV